MEIEEILNDPFLGDLNKKNFDLTMLNLVMMNNKYLTLILNLQFEIVEILKKRDDELANKIIEKKIEIFTQLVIDETKVGVASALRNIVE